ncbi:MAG: GIY-YIG nuclease family protein [Patescibacteria group bacterium]
MALHLLYVLCVHFSELKIPHILLRINLRLEKRLTEHNSGKMKSTLPHAPWTLIWYGVLSTEKEAKDFKLYLQSGSGKAFYHTPGNLCLLFVPFSSAYFFQDKSCFSP